MFPCITWGDEKVTDFTTVGQNPLAVSRHCNSEGGVFGNWRWTYDRGVFISPTEVDVIRADEKVIYFLPNGSGGVGLLLARHGTADRLHQRFEGNHPVFGDLGHDCCLARGTFDVSPISNAPASRPC